MAADGCGLPLESPPVGQGKSGQALFLAWAVQEEDQCAKGRDSWLEVAPKSQVGRGLPGNISVNHGYIFMLIHIWLPPSPCG